MKSVYVSGLGVVSPLGIDIDTYWRRLCEADSRFSSLESVYPGMKPGCAAGILDSSDKSAIRLRAPPSTGRNIPDSSLYAVDAAVQAIGDAGYEPGDPVLRNTLVCIGNNEAEADLLDNWLEGKTNEWPSHVYSSHAIADHVARAIGSEAGTAVIHNTCASGNAAFELALSMMRLGVVTSAIVGGGDAFSKKVWTGFHTLGALGSERCRPFSVKRRYITISEGAAMLFLTSLPEKSREPYARLVGAVSNNDAVHPTNPDAKGVSACHDAILNASGVKAEAVDVIYAHGTGTKANDAVEGAIFSQRYANSAVTAIKGTVGHMMATAGAAGAVAACLSLRHQAVPPTNIEADEREFSFDLVLDGRGRRRAIQYVQNNSFGFGGNNAIAMFARP